MTDTPPPRSIPYVPGRLGQEPLTGDVPVEPTTLSQPAADLLPASPPQQRSRTPLLIGGLVVLVVVLAGIVAVLATRTSGDASNAAAAPSPSWTSVFATTTPAAAYSPPPPREISVPFGEVLTLTSNAGDEVNYTVVADKTYTKTKYGTKPEKGILYGVKATIEVVDGSVYACACDFALVAADGTVYEGASHSVNGGLEAVTLNRKQKASGIVVFDVPAGAPTGGRVELREGSTNQGFWTIP